VQDLISVANIVYAVTSDGCNGVPNAVWSVALENNMVNEWKPEDASVIGLAFAGDGTVYATTTKGIAALDQKTLKVKAEDTSESITGPLVFKFKDKEYVVAANAHGHILVRDPATLASVVNVPGNNAKIGSSLASWEDPETKTRWVLASKNGGILALKVVEENGTIALQQGWATREMGLTSLIVVNGVAFALSPGTTSAPAMLFAYDAMTGKELWNSGKAISGYSTTGISAGASKVYVGTHDGTLYAFGYLLPRE